MEDQEKIGTEGNARDTEGILKEDHAVTIEGSPAPSATTGPDVSRYTITAVTTAEEFDALGTAWDALLGECDARVFQTFEWLHTWWEELGRRDPKRSLMILLVQADAVLVGIAPFFIEKVAVAGILRYRRLLFIGHEASDYLDILARRGWEDPVLVEIASYLARHRSMFTTLQLEEIRDGSPTHRRLFELLLRHGFAGDHYLDEYCPRTVLGKTWQETTASFPKSHRNRLLRRMDQLTGEVGLTFEHVTDPASIEDAMDEFIAMHQARWNVLGHQGVFGSAATDRFHRAVAPHLYSRGWLYLAFLKAGDRRVVGDYGLIFRDECATYLGGSSGDSEIMRLSPGIVLLMRIMKECHGQGIRVYDFLRGTERYKYNLGAVDVPNWSLLMFTRPGRVYPLLHRAGLLSNALSRRAAYEWSAFLRKAKKHGLLSLPVASHVLARTRAVLADAVQKFREPEKSVVIGRDRK